ncbi:MAG: hypothetical protein WCK89_14360, partial [bacterium]
QAVEGDVEIVARVATMVINTREPKAGIMLRETLGDNAKHASMLLGGLPGGARLFSRKDTGGASSISKANTLKAPYWVKLVRRGNTFSGYLSEDGETWTQAGADLTITMPTKLFAGLAVSAGNRDGSRLHASDFDHVMITQKTGKKKQ